MATPLLGNFTKQLQNNYNTSLCRVWLTEQFSLRRRRQTYSEEDSLTDDGRAFRTWAAAAEKERSPRVLQRVAGTSKSWSSVERRWRRRRPSILDASCKDSAIYAGAVPRRQRYANTQRRNLILQGTFHQWRFFRTGVIRSDFCAAKTRRAAALITDWSRRMKIPETPARTELQ